MANNTLSLASFDKAVDLAPTIIKVLCEMKITTYEVLAAVVKDDELFPEVIKACVDKVQADPSSKGQSKPATGASASSGTVQTESTGVDYKELEKKILRARVKAALLGAVERCELGSSRDVDKVRDLFVERCMINLGFIPTDHMIAHKEVLQKLSTDPLQFIEFKLYEDAGESKVSEQEWNGKREKKGGSRSKTVSTLSQWTIAALRWATALMILTEGPVFAAAEYVARIMDVVDKTGSFAAAMEYDRQVRSHLAMNVKRIREDGDKSLKTPQSLGQAIAWYLTYNYNQEAYARALHRPKEERSAPYNRESRNLTGNRVPGGVCKYAKDQCPYPSCRYKIHIDELDVENKEGKTGKGKGPSQGKGGQRTRGEETMRADFLSHSIADSTKKNYEHAQRLYLGMGLSLPPTGPKLSRFVRGLTEATDVRVQTAKKYISGIKTLAAIQGLEPLSGLENQLVDRSFKAMERMRAAEAAKKGVQVSTSTVSKSKTPTRAEGTKQAIIIPDGAVRHFMTMAPLRGSLKDKYGISLAALLTGVTLALRPKELLGIRMHDITVSPLKKRESGKGIKVSVNLGFTKTRRFEKAEAQCDITEAECANRGIWCTSHYLAAEASAVKPNILIFGGLRGRLAEAVKELSVFLPDEALRQEFLHFTGYSMRRTGATLQMKSGLDKQIIMEGCRWRTPAMVERYTREECQRRARASASEVVRHVVAQEP
ncbi:hypothetical protein FOZ63_024839 [Perkinsus olseni]|uniref:Uncharacterized protein n=1 Tax=Perkinsus olseni TaxID=32597 RepID=A0A7J6UB38_PEROL|nr:hypothetical protein FOZ60_005797 [Perkinsus olseni]KAF4724879.1 hypothetical protein FOZ63_024839 [Perkinsus olseni]KAF4754414.1 hypothetical protein FOZ62_017998 [Perkinsus olseni]